VWRTGSIAGLRFFVSKAQTAAADEAALEKIRWNNEVRMTNEARVTKVNGRKTPAA
jgi:hypothetical protein